MAAMISDFILFISSLISLRISCLRDSRSPLPPPAPVGGNEDAAVSWPVNEGCRDNTLFSEVRLGTSAETRFESSEGVEDVLAKFLGRV